jgi:ppGpp synthetase/RelA/SpoT-type nucleotidyltranferase
MDYEEYTREGRLQYESFARTVAAILQAAINDSAEDFRLQQITFRAKSNESLYRKLDECNLLQSQSVEAELKDLAGCRLVFYTNTDIDRFLNSRLIFENFKVDFEGSKIHHAVGKDRPAEQLYFGIHYLVSLTDERLALPEYRKFRGLRCETQIQTILNHAWAETSHDILYHRPDIAGFGTRQFAAIKERLTKIMNKYLLPAGYEFQMVQHDFNRLLQGKELFDRNTIEALKTAEKNNDRHDHLRRIRTDLLPFYDDVSGVAPEIIRATVEAIKKARSAPEQEIETPLGNLSGRTAEQVASAGLEIIEDLRYSDIQETFRVLCDLYATATADEERRRILQVAERLAHHDLEVWRQAGFFVQKVLQESISALSDAERTSLSALVLTVARQTLDPELTGTSWHFQSVSLHRGAVQASEQFAIVRNNVLDLLFKMYGEAKSEQDKRNIVHTLDQATALPGGAAYDDALTIMVLDNTRRVAEFFAARTETEQFEILQTLEHHYSYLYRRTKDLAQAHAASDSETAEKANAVVSAIEQFRDRVNSNEGFVRFKTLVGYESVFPPDWDGEAHDIQRATAYRAARITEYVASVTTETADEWYGVIRRCASVQSNDGATFLNFGEFLKQLAARNPSIVFKYLEKGEGALTGFLPAVLQGLAQGKEAPAALTLMGRWVDAGLHLAAIARHLRLTPGAPSDLIRKVGEKALEAKDLIAVIEIIAAVVAHNAVDLVDPIVVPGIRLFTAYSDARWVQGIWFMSELGEFIANLSETQSEVVLENLTLCTHIDYHTERILQSIADRFPASVWRFFKARLEREEEKEKGDRYEAIPYELRELRKPLSKDPALALETVRGWYSSNDIMFQFKGGKLLHNVFPQIGAELEASLIRILQEGTDEAIDFVRGILRTYHGEVFLHGICKEIVDKLPEDDKRLGEIEVVLQATGVVSGHFGFVEVYQRRKDEVSDWLNDSRPKVRSFAERYQRSLDRTIAAEQRRSESDYELRRREWPDEGQ